jgi:hypothetical protein
LIVLGVAMTLLVSRALSVTILRGALLLHSGAAPLPPGRNAGRILVRSLLDRTIFVLGRALAVAAPAGLIIWALGRLGLTGYTGRGAGPPGTAPGAGRRHPAGLPAGTARQRDRDPHHIDVRPQHQFPDGLTSLGVLGLILRSAGWTAKTAACFLSLSCSTPPAPPRCSPSAGKSAAHGAIPPWRRRCPLLWAWRCAWR